MKSITMIISLLVLTVSAWGQVIHEDLKLLASDGVSGDQFGIAIAIETGTVIVGAFGDDDNGSLAGSAYMFNANTGVQTAKMLPSDGAEGDLFGQNIAIDNGLIAIGARKHSIGRGAAYVFNASTGAQIMKLIPSDAAPNDNFGGTIDIDNGIVAVGSNQNDDFGISSGAAYLFHATTGDQLFKLLPTDGAIDDNFGFSIAIDDGVVAVGSIRDDDNGSDSGSVYLFDATTGVQINKILPDDGAYDDFFGYSVDIADGLLAVGVWHDDDNGYNSGSAYVFDIATGNQISKLLANDGAAEDEFGKQVAIDNGSVVVGAYVSDPNGVSSGSAYLFNATTGAQITKILPSDGIYGEYFGVSVAINNGVIGAGALFDGDNGALSGSAYLFDDDNVALEDVIAQRPDASLMMQPNHPNPFNPSTTIRYTLEYPGEVELAVYSARGIRVRTLVSGRQSAGTEHSVIWDGTDDQGRAQPSGVYFAKLQSGGMMELEKMVLMK